MDFRGSRRRVVQLGGWAALLAAIPGLALAQTAAITPEELFQSLCVAHRAQPDPIEAAAQAIGFKPPAFMPPAPETTTRIVALERVQGSAKQVLAITLGRALFEA